MLHATDIIREKWSMPLTDMTGEQTTAMDCEIDELTQNGCAIIMGSFLSASGNFDSTYLYNLINRVAQINEFAKGRRTEIIT